MTLTAARLAALAAITLLFFIPRIALLVVREPFFDELFTLWMARQPFRSIVPNLLNDSGPPLYYVLARFESVTVLRWLSLAFATVQFVIVTRRSTVAALLLAVFPPAVLFAVDARAYALCALLVTAGVLLWDRDRMVPASLCFVGAAYTHYYGVLFFPLLLFRRSSKALGVTLLFIPGLLLAMRQPVEAFAWVHEPIWKPLVGLSQAAAYPNALFASPPLLFVAIGLALFALAAVRSFRYAPAVLIPVALVMLFALFGRPVYFPMRFESVIAGPLVLWVGDGISKQTRWRAAFLAAFAGIGALAVTIGIYDHRTRPLDRYREAAVFLAANARPEERVFATGYLYLETASVMERPIGALPAEQALHPGWRARTPVDPATLPGGPFLWIVEKNTREVRAVTRVRPAQRLYENERAIILRVLD